MATCNRCGERNLEWEKHDGAWRLVTVRGHRHRCGTTGRGEATACDVCGAWPLYVYARGSTRLLKDENGREHSCPIKVEL